MRFALLLCSFVALCFPGTTPAGPVTVTGTMNYVCDFDALGTAAQPWQNDSLLPGWYAQINNGHTAPGTLHTADGRTILSGLLNLGSDGSPDRALGSKATGTGNLSNIACGVLFQNTGTVPVAVSRLRYTGELWRTNTGTGTPLTPVTEKFRLFYRLSGTLFTDLQSGTGSATATAGQNYLALDGESGWDAPVDMPLGTALDGNAAENRTVVTVDWPGITVPPGQYLMIKWTDANESGTDGFQGIDDVSIAFAELDGLVSTTVSQMTRDERGTPGNPADDSFGFTLTVTGSGNGIGQGWTTTGVSAPNAASGTYGAPVVWSGFPVSKSLEIIIKDDSSPMFNAVLAVAPPRLIGTNAISGGSVLTAVSPGSDWAVDDVARTLTQNGGQMETPATVRSEVIDLSGVTGQVRFTATLEIADTSSGFEETDTLRAHLLLDGGGEPAATLDLLLPWDTDRNGMLQGAELAGSMEQKTLQLSGIIADAYTRATLKISGRNDSASERMLFRDIRFEVSPPALGITAAGLPVVDHKGTASAEDDTFSTAVAVIPGNNTPSTGWKSDQTPPAGGSYNGLAAVTHTFGPYPLAGGPRTVTLTDQTWPAAQTALILAPPVRVFSAAPVENVRRHENGPGFADDTVTFDTVITMAHGGPHWTAAGGVTPATGAAGPVTFTVPAGESSVTVLVADVSYPESAAEFTVTLPDRYAVGRFYDGRAVTSLSTSLDSGPAPAWVHDPAALTLDMDAGGTSDKVVLSEVIDLTARGTVHFSVLLRAREESDTSNFETSDRFKAELLIDTGTPAARVINLVSAWDTGDGASAVSGDGRNGPPDGFINGYSGTAGTDVLTGAVYEDASADYHAHRIRDEFNASPGQTVDGHIDRYFPLTHTIPASAHTVQLRLTGAGVSSSEFFTVANVIFSTIPPGGDSDQDGVPDVSEILDGTGPLDPSSFFGIAGIQSGPQGVVQAQFPTVTGRYYQGYISSDLVTWTRDGSDPALSGTGTLLTWPLPRQDMRRYLRIITGTGPNAFPPVLP